MEQRFEGYRRLTHRFADAWKARDDWAFVGIFLILNTRHRLPRSPCEGSAGGVSTYTVRAPRGAGANDVRDALQEYFASECRCSHDCCGCAFTRVLRITRSKRREWCVDVGNYRNV